MSAVPSVGASNGLGLCIVGRHGLGGICQQLERGVGINKHQYVSSHILQWKMNRPKWSKQAVPTTKRSVRKLSDDFFHAFGHDRTAIWNREAFRDGFFLRVPVVTSKVPSDGAESEDEPHIPRLS